MAVENAVPWAAIGQAVLGGAQSIIGGANARRDQRKLEKMIDGYKPNQSIMDYYSKALNRYNANPYTSSSYNQSMRSADRNLATGLNSLQDRRSALGGVAGLVDATNNASVNAAADAERMQGQNLAQLGQATGMKEKEDKYKFEAKYNLLSQKAGAGNQTANAGISNLYGGLGGIQDYAMINKTYK